MDELAVIKSRFRLLPRQQTLEQIWKLAAGNIHIAALIASIGAYAC